MSEFESKILAKQVEKDHAEALRSDKLGKKLVKKTVKLIEDAELEKRLISPSLVF